LRDVDVREKRVGSAVPHESPHLAPIQFADAQGRVRAVLKVDAYLARKGEIVVTGWMAGPIEVALIRDGRRVASKVTRHLHHGASAALETAAAEENLGFTLTARAAEGVWAVQAKVNIDGAEYARLYPLPAQSASRLAANDARRFVEGNLEIGYASADGRTTVIAGWECHASHAKVLLQVGDHPAAPLTRAYRFFRDDVADPRGRRFGLDAAAPGFIACIEGARPGDEVALLAECDGEKFVVSKVECRALPDDAVAASECIFGLSSPLGDLHRRIPLIDRPVLAPLIERMRRDWSQRKVESKVFGEPCAKPLVSVIVPLYGRSDFLEDQVLEFARDAWFHDNAELIVVIDDPRLASRVHADAARLHRIYGVPFKVIGDGGNRGFAGANNLGASCARARNLLFLNSDAFPKAPGWLQALLAALNSDASLGAVAPRLVHADGSIQHAGMAFMRREDLGVWVNHHPLLGLDVSLDVHSETTVVPAVTGACLLVRRAAFRKIGGWDTGYLIGDFEDSDLCLKLRAAGLRVAYVPGVELTHLERQSFRLAGGDDFRTRVTLFNAVRHQERWADALAEAAP
jgi:O-antigen biosynthesis protein